MDSDIPTLESDCAPDKPENTPDQLKARRKALKLSDESGPAIDAQAQNGKAEAQVDNPYHDFMIVLGRAIETYEQEEQALWKGRCSLVKSFDEIARRCARLRQSL